MTRKIGSILLAITALTVIGTEAQETPVVEIDSGLVRGAVRNLDDGNKVNLYQGIRYGRAERFQKPSPVEPWTGIFEANEYSSECPQPNLNLTSFKQRLEHTSEDCLFLDVWQPTTKSVTPRSIMFWIHGGGLVFGSANQYDFARFAHQGDVIVVSINYRLGALGFLNGGTENEPGNLGLYDMILALKWVKNNGIKFGGNPKDVTIFGESAGGWAVGLLTLSPLTTDLFHRAILQSGAPYDNLFEESHQDSIEKTLKFATRMDCFKNGEEEEAKTLANAMECLRKLSANDLVQIPVGGEGDMNNRLSPHYGDQLLPMAIGEALRKFDRKLDLMFGATRDEGTLMVPLMFPTVDLSDNITLESTREAAKTMVKTLELKNGEKVVEHYTGQLTEETSKDQLRTALSDLAGDYLITCPTVLFGQIVARRILLTSKSSDNHFYAFRWMAPLESQSEMPAWMGVTHGQDLAYLFASDLMGKIPENSENFQKLNQDMVKVWTDFAKTGKISGKVSGVEWTEAIDRQNPDSASVSYFSLDPANYKMVDNYWKETCEQLWNPIFTHRTNLVKNAKTEL